VSKTSLAIARQRYSKAGAGDTQTRNLARRLRKRDRSAPIPTPLLSKKQEKNEKEPADMENEV